MAITWLLHSRHVFFIFGPKLSKQDCWSLWEWVQKYIYACCFISQREACTHTHSHVTKSSLTMNKDRYCRTSWWHVPTFPFCLMPVMILRNMMTVNRCDKKLVFLRWLLDSSACGSETQPFFRTNNKMPLAYKL